MPRAVRAEVATCAATAATAVNTRPEPISARPNASDPDRGTPVPARLIVPSTPTATAAPPRQQQRGGQVREPAHRGGGDQFGTPGLLVRAGVPNHREYRRDSDERVKGAGLPDTHRADAGVEHRSIHCTLGGAGGDRGGERGAVRGGREDALDARHIHRAERQREHQDPQRQHDPVAPRVEAEQAERAGEVAVLGAGRCGTEAGWRSCRALMPVALIPQPPPRDSAAGTTPRASVGC